MKTRSWFAKGRTATRPVADYSAPPAWEQMANSSSGAAATRLTIKASIKGFRRVDYGARLLILTPPRTSTAGWALLSVLALISGSSGRASQTPALAPAELVRHTVWNEMHPDMAAYMFQDRKETPRGSQTKLMVETRDAMAGLIIALDDHPLTADQRQAEDERVDRFLKDPGELEKRKKQEKEDTEHTERIVKALPDAFLYEYDGTEPGRKGVGRPGDTLTRLKFRPNPNYDPPSHVEQVLVGMRGYLLIDTFKQRIARIDGTLEKEVNFGWGILGHLDRGGHFLVEQGDVGDGHWEITHMQLAITGKLLLFKSLNFQSNEVESDFRAVPTDLTFAQGLELLRKQEAVLAEDGEGRKRAEK